MEAFWCIVLSFFTLKSFLKRERRKAKERKAINSGVSAEYVDELSEVEELDRKAQDNRQREKEAEELRKQGYTEDIIAIILPTINNGQ